MKNILRMIVCTFCFSLYHPESSFAGMGFFGLFKQEQNSLKPFSKSAMKLLKAFDRYEASQTIPGIDRSSVGSFQLSSFQPVNEEKEKNQPTDKRTPEQDFLIDFPSQFPTITFQLSSFRFYRGNEKSSAMERLPDQIFAIENESLAVVADELRQQIATSLKSPDMAVVTGYSRAVVNYGENPDFYYTFVAVVDLKTGHVAYLLKRFL